MSRLSLFLAIFITVCPQLATASDLTELSPAFLTQQGVAAYHRGDYAAAIKYLSNRIQMTPADPMAYYYLGNSFLQSKQNDQAAHMYSACVRLAPASPAGRFALSALENLSTMPKGTAIDPKAEDKLHSAMAEASKDALMSDGPLDKNFNDAVKRIKSQRQTVKTRIDRIWELLQDDILSMSPKATTNYAAEMERLRREAENKVEDIQTKELRFESRLLGPNKIDARALPQIPQEKSDNSKTALGSLFEYFKPDTPYDPLATEITPEITAKFMTIKDVFGDLAIYQPSARKMAKQIFQQLKSSIENKQDWLDIQIYQLKANLIKDLINIKISYGNSATNQQLTAAYHIASSKLPRSDQNSLTPLDIDVSKVAEGAKKRIKELETSYYKEIDLLMLGAKERIGGVVSQGAQMHSQLKHASGNIQIVPLGTDTYTRNYVNFADRADLNAPKQPIIAAPKLQALKAQAKKLPVKKLPNSEAGKGSK